MSDLRPRWGTRPLRSRFSPLSVANAVEVGQQRGDHVRIEIPGMGVKGDGPAPRLVEHGFRPAEGPTWLYQGEHFRPWVKAPLDNPAGPR